MNFLIFSSEEFMPKTNVCLNSIKQYHPESTIYLEKVDYKKDGHYLVDLGKKRLEKLISLLEEKDQTIVMIGADCVLYDRIDDLEHKIANHSIILTPHVVTPPSRDQGQLHLTGYINADFIVVNRNSLPILRWLMAQDFKNVPQQGFFYEQSHLTHVPFIFDDVLVLRDMRYNCAYWNHHERGINKRDGVYWTNDGRLKMFHFSGFTGDCKKMSRYNKYEDASGDLLNLFEEYKELVGR